MDSMRSLNTSLPTSSPKSRSTQPPEQLLQAFRTAALSVTNLYKTAALDQTQARQAGYQDAIDDLLLFLDKENLGLGDGEGWKVRQWATERLGGSPPAPAGSDSDDERADMEKRAESPSPVVQRKPSPEAAQDRPITRPGSPIRAETAPPIPILSAPHNSILSRPETFTFRSPLPYPQDADMQAPDSSPAAATYSDIQSPVQTPTSTSTSAVRLEVLSRGSRTPHRHGNHTTKHNTRSTTSVRTLGAGAGSKRRIAFGEFFDLGSLGDGKDGFGGGGKRGRLN
ncbi:hypothetical protein MMC24_001906 [Lignoscripta atroalba]|nr:hypothetical protein [Lignoscripta atroalba]